MAGVAPAGCGSVFPCSHASTPAACRAPQRRPRRAAPRGPPAAARRLRAAPRRGPVRADSLPESTRKKGGASCRQRAAAGRRSRSCRRAPQSVRVPPRRFARWAPDQRRPITRRGVSSIGGVGRWAADPPQSPVACTHAWHHWGGDWGPCTASYGGFFSCSSLCAVDWWTETPDIFFTFPKFRLFSFQRPDARSNKDSRPRGCAGAGAAARSCDAAGPRSDPPLGQASRPSLGQRRRKLPIVY